MSDLVSIAAGSNANDVPFILDCLDDEAQCRTDTVDWFIKQFLAYCGFPCCIETPRSNNVNRHLSPRQQRATTYNSRMRISLSFKRAFLNIDNIYFYRRKSKIFVVARSRFVCWRDFKFEIGNSDFMKIDCLRDFGQPTHEREHCEEENMQYDATKIVRFEKFRKIWTPWD
jgi:hypothetical protein